MKRMVEASYFRALFETNYSALVRYACHRGLDRDEADDLIAGIFEVAWRRLDEIPRGDEAVLWLYGVAFNQLRNLRRSKRRHQRLVARLRFATPEPGPSEPSEVSIEELKAALDALAVDDREVILLVAAEGLSAAQVGEVLGCGANTARSRLHRARRRLARLLGVENTAQRATRPGHKREEVGETTEAWG
jgi:RNA polymerase sigma factor (sigma-70 family)